MLQSMVSQRAGHDLVMEQQQRSLKKTHNAQEDIKKEITIKDHLMINYNDILLLFLQIYIFTSVSIAVALVQF